MPNCDVDVSELKFSVANLIKDVAEEKRDPNYHSIISTNGSAVTSCEFKYVYMPQSCLKVIQYYPNERKFYQEFDVHNKATCHVCGRVFNAKYNLLRHMPIHTGERAYVCRVCGKAFRQASTLCRHRIIHTGRKPYECNVCLKRFNRSSTLNTHMKIHLGIKPWKCAYCGKSFHQKGNYKNHLNTHQNKDIRSNGCSVCNRSINSSFFLKFDMFICNEKKPVTCNFCKVHTGEGI